MCLILLLSVSYLHQLALSGGVQALGNDVYIATITSADTLADAAPLAAVGDAAQAAIVNQSSAIVNSPAVAADVAPAQIRTPMTPVDATSVVYTGNGTYNVTYTVTQVRMT